MYGKYILTSGSLVLAVLLSSCVVNGADPDVDNIGWFGGPSVVYNVNKIGSNKYTLEASTAHGVTNNKLLTVYKARAAKLCQPKTPTLNYKISTETYMGTFNATLKLPMTAPKITGIVTCK